MNDTSELAAFIADPELAEMFIADALDHLGTIEATILKLEAAPGDLALINEIFRPFHTVKGNAGVLGLTSIQEFAHTVETLLDLARSGAHAIGPQEIDVILQAVDLLTLVVQELPARASGHATTDVSARRRDLMATVDRLIGGEAGRVPLTDSPPLPRVPVAASGDGPESAKTRRDDGQSTVKVDTRKLDTLVDLVGELVIAQAILAEDPALLGAGDERLNRRLAQVKRITADLQRTAMTMRMVPIRQTFQKMARLVRDLARTCDRPIDLLLSGEATELDRKVVEDVTDPLMHMVRNTIDHGIEPAAVRAAAGKPPTALLTLSAFHRGGGIVIEIADDGAGLDTQRILDKAVMQKIVPEGVQLTADEIHRLIFQPGFSTADCVTELSGRGVGMDVVYRNIEALRGHIDIRTARGVGTTFSIQLPLTLAIVDGILLRVGSERFIVPTFSVRESLRPNEAQVHTLRGKPCMVQVRERVIPLLRLADLFGIIGARQSPCEGTVVIIEDNGPAVAIAVDELLGKQEVVIKSLGESFGTVPGIAGAAILGDGRIGLILDGGGLVAMAGRTTARTAA